MKRIIAIALTICMMLAIFAGCSSGSGNNATAPAGSTAAPAQNAAADNAETIVIRVNSAIKSSTVEETANGLGILQFVDKVRERTDGKYEIKLFSEQRISPAGVLESLLSTQAEAEPATMMDLIPLMLHEQEDSPLIS